MIAGKTRLNPGRSLGLAATSLALAGMTLIAAGLLAPGADRPQWPLVAGGLALLLGMPAVWAAWRALASPAPELSRLQAELEGITDPDTRLTLRKDLLEVEYTRRATAAESLVACLQAVSALGLIVGLVFTWLQLQSADRTAQQNLDLTREGQITERFTKAIEQLGSERPDVRIGAVYALDRIAWESDSHYWSVMEVLTAFVREHTRYDAGPAGVANDTQTILTLVGRRRLPSPPRAQGVPANDRVFPLDFKYADLRTANLTGARLAGAYMWKAHLEDAQFPDADLTEAFLKDAQLKGANLQAARLEGANLERANLDGANLEALADRPQQGGARLARALLGGATLTGAKLKCAHLEDTDLSAAIGLTPEQVAEAFTNEGTTLPPRMARPPKASPQGCPR